MAEERIRRRLTAILVADVAGYSRLVGEDEEGILANLSGHRRELIDPKIREYGGRIANTAGDSLLVEFPSVVEALRCAVDLQRGIAERNADVPADRRVEFRVGINLGDVVEQDGDLLGDGVNVAARLEGMARPGEIVVSAMVHESVRSKLEFGFVDLGPQRFKNIAEPVRTYRVVLEGQPLAGVTRGERRRRWFIPAIAAAVLALIATGAIIWHRPWESFIDLASVAPRQLPLPDKPSIAILPFDNLSEDRDQDYFAHGLADDLITDLSKISGLFVIARNSSFTYIGRPVKARQVAQELGVRYVLEGSVRKASGSIRINAQLVDTSTGGYLWADRYDGALTDVFALQDKITRKIVDALALKLTKEEQARTTGRATRNPDAYDAYLQGWEHYLRFTPTDFEAAVKAFRKALALDPGYTRANAALAATYWQSWKRQWHGNVGFTHAAWARADKYLRKALAEPSPLAYQVSSEMLTINRRYDQAIAEARRAVELDPNRARGYVTLAEALTYAGRADEAIRPVHKAMRHDPHSPAGYLLALGRAQLALSQFEAAAITLERAVLRNPSEHNALVLLIAAYGHLKRDTQAAHAIAKLNALRKESGLSPFTLETLRNRLPYRKRADRDHLLAGLRMAGLPEW